MAPSAGDRCSGSSDRLFRRHPARRQSVLQSVRRVRRRAGRSNRGRHDRAPAEGRRQHEDRIAAARCARRAADRAAPISAPPAPAVQPVEPVAPRAVSARRTAAGRPTAARRSSSRRVKRSALLSTRYGVPSDALLSTNGFSSASQVTPGARLVIPVYRNGASPAVRTAAAPAPTPAHAPAPVAKVEPKKETLKLVKAKPEPAKSRACSKPRARDAEASPRPSRRRPRS